MSEGLFRKKSMEKMSSPEQLNDYIRVSNPGVWMVLVAVVVLLVGMCVWGIFGRLETTIDIAAVSENGQAICYVTEDKRSEVAEGMSVRINDTEYPVSSIAVTPIQVTEDFDAYAIHVGELQTGEWVYEVYLDADLADGSYQAKLITESVAPASFLTN